MENKYYTPEIGEFHHGFEYETSINTKDWYTNVFTITEENLWLQEFKNPSFVKYIRCKLLDKEDIESLDFVEIGQEEYEFENWYFEKVIGSNYNLRSNDQQFIFITIKNKSELIKLLKQIGIC